MFWRRNRDRDRDLDEEVQSWFDIRVSQHRSCGMSPEGARREARRGFYGPEQVKQQVREERRGAGLESILRDIRYASRALRKSPGFTAVAVLTLGLGMGANTAIFSLINAVMLRILPVSHPEQLVLLTDPGSSGVDVETTESDVRDLLAYAEFTELRDRTQVFSGLFAAESDPRPIDVYSADQHQLHRARLQLVSGEFFSVLGIGPAGGQFFTAAQDRVPGANPVAVISWNFWQRDFAGDPAAVGRTLRIGQGTFQIIGIAPENFRGIQVGADSDVWVPITMQAQAIPGRDYLTPHDTLWLQVMGRLKPGISIEAAQSSITVTMRQMLEAWRLPAKFLNQRLVLHPGAKGASDLRDRFADPLLILMGMVGLVLLIACANIANLMLARVNARHREIEVRMALGAARFRLIRQIMTESVLIACLGGMLGTAFAWLGTRALVAFASASITGLSLDMHSDLRVFLFTAAASLLTGILFGFTPALRETRGDRAQSLAGSQRGASTARLRGRRVLVVAQIALSVVLVTGAALLARSLRNVLSESTGFDHSHLLLIGVDPVSTGYKGAALRFFFQNVLDGLNRLPGAAGATLANTGLFGGGDSGDEVSLDGSPVHDKNDLHARWTLVGPHYFSTLGVPITRGRELDDSDAARATQFCVVNEAFARTYYPNLDPIGHHITDEYPTTRETYEIIGVAANAKEHSPREREVPRFYPTMFHPIGTVYATTFLLRTNGDPAAAASAARALLRSLAPTVNINDIRTADEQLSRRLVTQRLIANLSGLFGLLGLFMAAIGLYGVMSYAINRRTAEIGVRMALGASRPAVMGMILRETLWLVLGGILIGVPCALAAGRLLKGMLFGIQANDPVTLTVTAAVITIACCIAAGVPARRASQIDPMNALRCD